MARRRCVDSEHLKIIFLIQAQSQMLGLSELHLLGGIHDWFPDWAIGVLLAFGGCTLSNFGAPDRFLSFLTLCWRLC